MTTKKTTQTAPSSHDIDTSYLLELKRFYENRFLNWLELEGNLVSAIALLDIKLKLFKDKNDVRYLENCHIVNTLAELKDSVSSFMFLHEKLKYENKNIKMDNARLKEANETLKGELNALRRYNNV